MSATSSNRLNPLIRMVPILFLLLAGSALAAVQIDPDNCLLCHRSPWLGVTDSTGVQFFQLDAEHLENSVHGRIPCRDCHADIDQVPHKIPVAPVDCAQACHMIDAKTGKDFSHTKIARLLDTSVHAGSREGDLKDRRPGCTDCHTNSLYDVEMPLALSAGVEKCRNCHENEEFRQQLNHMALHLDTGSLRAKKQSYAACARCHTDNDLLADSLKLRLDDDDMVASFLRSFHGRGFNYGDLRSPVCADCHGYHRVYKQSDERSTIHPANIRQTCSTTDCHDGATLSFATSGSMHDLYVGNKALILTWIKAIYILLIFGVIGGMIGHNMLDVVAWRRHRKQHPEVKSSKERHGKRYLRMNKMERVSHAIMFMSFTWLALSGALLWVPRENLSMLPDWMFLVEVRAWSHRLAAIAITLVALFHFSYILFTKRGRALFLAMLPRPLQDPRLMLANIRFMLGLSKDRPRFGHFNYSEKMEYWAFAWGTVVMTATGVILWWEQLGSKYIVDVARLVHSLEAILAVLAIVVWHFWNVHWKPGRWPMSEAWLEGSIDEESMEEEHYGLFVELQEDGKEHSQVFPGARVAEISKENRRRHSPMLRGFLKTLGYTFFVLITVSCLVMAWSFSQYVKQPAATIGQDSTYVMNQNSLDPLVQLLQAHQDPDLRQLRFHATLPAVATTSLENRSECTLCHSFWEHDQDPARRAWLNSHSRFMACEVCHAPEGSGQLSWLTLDGGNSAESPYGISRNDQGLLGADNLNKIIAVRQSKGWFFANRTSADAVNLDEDRAAMDHDSWLQLRKDRADAMHKRIAPVSQRALNCQDCHTTESSAIPWQSLGFSEEREAELRSAPIPSSVINYEEFHLAPLR